MDDFNRIWRDILRQIEELHRLQNMSPMDLLGKPVDQSKTVEELALSELIGRPVKIAKK